MFGTIPKSAEMVLKNKIRKRHSLIQKSFLCIWHSAIYNINSSAVNFLQFI
nr:MAG TPA: hypothetical protein [Caudoviricetes sp.]